MNFQMFKRMFKRNQRSNCRHPLDHQKSKKVPPKHPGLISFRMDRLDLFAVQGTLKSLLQHHSSKASVLQCSAFFTVQLSHPYMTTGKTIALTRWTSLAYRFSPGERNGNPLQYSCLKHPMDGGAWCRLLSMG